MKIVLAGGTGFLGRPLWSQLASHGHDVVVLTRGVATRSAIGRTVSWHPEEVAATGGLSWPSEIDGADVVINLSGEGIADRRWSDRRKQALRESRILTTRSLVAAVRAAVRKPTVFVGGSAVGYYGDTGDRPIDESFPPGSDFLATLCVDWEAEAHAAAALGCRVVLVRAGVALASDGGALKQLVQPFRFLAGGPIASGRQYISWIHRDDWVDLVEWVMERSQISGPVNATAPNPVTNAEFSAVLGQVLHRPSWLRVPAFALRLIVGEMADVALVHGQRVLPTRALDAGFRFTRPELRSALQAAVAAR
jgi:uncharacterized protein (TIGR01777 family)